MYEYHVRNIDNNEVYYRRPKHSYELWEILCEKPADVEDDEIIQWSDIQRKSDVGEQYRKKRGGLVDNLHNYI